MKTLFTATKSTYPGYRPEDYTTSYAKYFAAEMAPLPAHVTQVLAQAPSPSGTLTSLEEAPSLARDGYENVETGYAGAPDGSFTVAILTAMPRVAPCMWAWWFGWHGSQANRYKLWHPQAHQAARWQDGREDLTEYVGRTSLIEEYIGAKLAKAAIRFLPPAEMGFSPSAESGPQVFICARVGYSSIPLDIGWLLHQVRAVAGGAEMRSRFWMGGRHTQLRVAGTAPRLLANGLQKVARLPVQRAKDLLTHGAEEMNHLAQFLPELYAEFH